MTQADQYWLFLMIRYNENKIIIEMIILKHQSLYSVLCTYNDFLSFRNTISSLGTSQVLISNLVHVLMISWSPPWIHSVNNYSVSIINTTTCTTTVNITHNKVLVLSHDGQLLDQYHSLEIMITSNTYLGSITSNIFYEGIPINNCILLLYYNLSLP